MDLHIGECRSYTSRKGLSIYTNQLSYPTRTQNESSHSTKLGEQRGIFQKRGDNIVLSLTINVKILAKLDTTITLCTHLSRTELEGRSDAYPK
jgi:hypothetical protein